MLIPPVGPAGSAGGFFWMVEKITSAVIERK
jgi:hypothetical protein